MARRGKRAGTDPRRTWFRIVAGVLFLVALGFALESVFYGPRLWVRVPCWIEVNGREAVEAAAYRSREGTILVDLRHAPTQADMEGGGYLVQPYWGRVRTIARRFYQTHGLFAIVNVVWPPGIDLRPDDEFVPIDPKIESRADSLSFIGMEEDVITLHGKALLEPIRPL